jgi:hypothetical protein
MSKGVNVDVYPCAFDSGSIHAYGFRASGWFNTEPGTELIYSGIRYDGVGTDIVNQVVYKYFPSPTFNISSKSYMWFFTRTPRAEGVAALNA